MQRARWTVVFVGLVSVHSVASCGGATAPTDADGDPRPGSGSGPNQLPAAPGSGGETGAGVKPVPIDQCALTEPSRCDGGYLVYRNKLGECTGSESPSCAYPSFGSIRNCLETCPDALPEQGSCDHDYECVLRLEGCCEPCNQDSSEADYTAVRQDRLPDEPCASSCEACANPSAGTDGRYAVAACEDFRCEPWDIRFPRRLTEQHPVACTRDADCFLRNGVDCCERCDGDAYVALSSLAYLDDLCDPAQACAACDASPPSSVSAYCDEQVGQCKVAAN